MINKIVSFKQIPIIRRGDIKIVSPYTLPQKYDEDVFVKIEPNAEHENRFETLINLRETKNLARNQFLIDKEEKTLKNAGMDVWSTKQRGKGLGIVLHLNNVMELLENDLDKIELYSMGQAVLFHGKCKLRPSLRDKDDIETALYTVSLKDYKKFPQIKNVVQKATDYLDEVLFSGGVSCLNRQNLKKANDIVSEYIETINTQKLTPQEREDFGFSSGFDMVLTKERILENKDFFNDLFEKYKIDYKIK